LDSAVNKVYIKNKNRIAVPGFRKGKAPRKIIERMYGVEIFLSDALDDIVPDVMEFSLKATDLDVVGYPKVSDVELKDNNSYVEFTMIVALRPDVVIKEYKGLKAAKPAIDVSDDEIDAEIASVRKRNARIEKADRPAAKGDVAIIDFEGFVDDVAFEGGKGENYELELGSGQFIPGFEDKVEGMTVGEQKDLDLVFPEKYKEELAGKPVIFKVKLNELKEKILPDLDDEFAKDVSEFDTLEEYKADIKEGMLKTRQQDIDETFENLLMEQIVGSMEAEIPDAMIDEQVNLQMNNLNRQISAYGMQPEQYIKMMGLSPEQFKLRMRESSERQVKISLALQKISELEGLEITDDEIEEEYKDAADKYKTEIDKLKESVPKEDIMRDLKLRKAAKFVVDNAIAEEFTESDPEDPESKKSDGKAASKKQPAKKKSPAAGGAKTTGKKAAKDANKTQEEDQ